MLTSDRDEDKEASVKCLQIITRINKTYYQSIMNADGTEKLCAILRKYASSLSATVSAANRPQLQNEILLGALSVLCNLSDQREIKFSLSQVKDLSDFLLKILEFSMNKDMQSRCSVLVADVVSIDEKIKILMAEKGCLDTLMKLLDSDTEDLLVNAVNAIEILCRNNVKNQNYCCEKNVLESFIVLLELNSGEKYSKFRN